MLTIRTVRRGLKSQRVRQYLAIGSYCPRDIADLVGCSYQLVTKIRRELRLPSERDTLARRMAVLEQRVRDQGRMIAHFMAERCSCPAISSALIAHAGNGKQPGWLIEQ